MYTDLEIYVRMYAVVWEIFDSKNILWVQLSIKLVTQNLIPQSMQYTNLAVHLLVFLHIQFTSLSYLVGKTATE